jgi:hypothetical protein
MHEIITKVWPEDSKLLKQLNEIKIGKSEQEEKGLNFG